MSNNRSDEELLLVRMELHSFFVVVVWGRALIFCIDFFLISFLFFSTATVLLLLYVLPKADRNLLYNCSKSSNSNEEKSRLLFLG